MSTVHLIRDAVTTAITLGWALAGWIAVAAAVGTVVLLGAVAGVVWVVQAVRRRHTGPSWAHGRVRARILARGRVRRSRGRLSPRRPRRGPWRGSGAPETAPRDSSDAGTPPEPAQARSRHTPAWAHTDHHDDYEEAA